jgi:hypothetical protein
VPSGSRFSARHDTQTQRIYTATATEMGRDEPT